MVCGFSEGTFEEQDGLLWDGFGLVRKTAEVLEILGSLVIKNKYFRRKFPDLKMLHENTLSHTVCSMHGTKEYLDQKCKRPSWSWKLCRDSFFAQSFIFFFPARTP